MSGTRMRHAISLELVPSFVEVVRQGSFTRAAKALGVPKSTVSRHVSRLEEELGVALLHRTTRSLRLTEEGEQFYDQVATVIESVEEAARQLTAQRERPHGVLRISVLPDYEQLAPLVASFLAAYPEVSVDVNVTGDIVDLVGGRFDLGIRAGVLPDSTLVARRLTHDAFHLFASPDYIARRGEPKTVAQLADHNCVLFRPQQGVSTWTLEGPDGIERVVVRGSVGVDELSFIRGLVLSGVGIGLLPLHIFGEARHRVRRILPNHTSKNGSIHVVYPGSRHVPAKVRAFRDHLLANMKPS